MSDVKTFNLTIDSEGLAWLSIDVQGEKMNTLQAAFADEMKSILEELKGSEAKGLSSTR
ncbi:enoyl-CoA hydratase [Vibrio ishigakensis]|uniref:Enoyl-CoA hydratase n=1 Tax=Vibrio ishigakensis TaxID=1481914 RepID=A0A0B8Q963_9VIBR|nr:enoyl-CoA hydratase [Vibrio ishigakensis]